MIVFWFRLLFTTILLWNIIGYSGRIQGYFFNILILSAFLKLFVDFQKCPIYTFFYLLVKKNVPVKLKHTTSDVKHEIKVDVMSTLCYVWSRSISADQRSFYMGNISSCNSLILTYFA